MATAFAPIGVPEQQLMVMPEGPMSPSRASTACPDTFAFNEASPTIRKSGSVLLVRCCEIEAYATRGRSTSSVCEGPARFTLRPQS